jgi:hypothetical protein
MPAAHGLRVRVLGIDPAEASFARRGFADGDAAARARLELSGRTFILGYRAGLAEPAPGLGARLDAVEPALRGFAYEGAAMALAILDGLQPWRRGPRLAAFIAGPADAHVYMAHVGAGWAAARLRRGPGVLRRLDPLLRWLVLDGYGFHQGYFAPARYLIAQSVPPRFAGYAGRVFDQGLGRSLWFVACAQPDRAADAVARFPTGRRADLWSGLGLAAAYAGPAETETIARLRERGDAYAAHLAQGAAFAAAARERAGNPTAHTELACRALAGCTAAEAAAHSADARRDVPPDADLPGYEIWRARLRDALAAPAPAPVGVGV